MKYNNLIQVSQYFSNENTCKEHLEKIRWNGNVTCPHCGHSKVYKTNRGFKCANPKCYKKFSVITGTYFENTKIKLNKWFLAIYIISAHKKGISSLQLSRDIAVTQKTAWFMLHRIREMFQDKAPDLLEGIVEADETYIGGKDKNRHWDKKQDGRGTAHKAPVFGMVERDGDVRAIPIEKSEGKTLIPIILKNVSSEATLMTDEFGGYYFLNLYYKHGVINHNSKMYVKGDIHTQNIENFWSLLKRGIIGIYHFVSPKHLSKYCNEFSFRYNTREINEQERFDKSISQCNGRLKYNQLIAD